MSAASNTLPVAFAGCHGILTFPPSEDRLATSVLLLRPWGFDELCTRKFFRALAERLAAKGMTSLRFDYPGTVDALDPPEGQSLESWLAAAEAGIELLKRQSGCKDVVLFGFGLGSFIAGLLADHPSVRSVVHAAPVTSPRRYFRETTLRAKVIIEGLGLPETALAKDATSIAGLVMDDRLVSDIKSATTPSTTKPSLVVARPGIDADQQFSSGLRESGSKIDELSFVGYDRLMEDPTASVIPHTLLDEIADWCAESNSRPNRRTENMPPPAAALDGSDFQEEGHYIGEAPGLYAIECRPRAITQNAPVFVFLNSGYDHHGGWARAWVDASRRLAAKGAVSLRVDFANIGDSGPQDGAPEQVLYSDGPILDTHAILDFLRKRHEGPITLVGRCSGAYTAFHAAYRDDRISQLLLCNQVRLIWDPEESLTDPARMGPRSMGDYKKRFVDPKTLKRLVTGDISIPGVLRGLGSHAKTRLSHLLAPIFPNISKHARFRAECHKMFRALKERDVAMHFVCSDADQSLEQLALYFGKGQKGLAAYPNTSLMILPGADHNLTPRPARLALFDKLEDLATARPGT
ncbi:alpha/beta hydrolase [Roseibium sediminis]|uniref:alpha/beta hydrolase n=1 Tax=Roseibium sediminis TaxID=1775174 RepID=UPI00123CCC1B|nr:alpha/beta hydrolase [Roseibium sediminis]